MAVAYFNKRFKGYDTKEVDEFIVGLVADSEQKIKEYGDAARELRARIKELEDLLVSEKAAHNETRHSLEARIAESDGKYASLCAQMGEKMHVADERAAAIVDAAKQKANDIISEAEKRADDITSKAKSGAEAEAKRIISDTRERCAAIERAAEAFERRQREISGGLERAIADIEAGLSDIQSTINNDGENNG